MDGRFLEPIAADNVAGPVFRTIQLATPAAGADLTQTVPGQSTWLFVSLTAKLVTSGAAANRLTTLKVTDGTNLIAQVPASVAVTATLTTTVCFIADGVTSSTAINGATVVVNAPKLIVPPGFIISTVTTAIDTADQYSLGTLTVVEMYAGQVAESAARLERIEDKLDALRANSLVPGS